MSTGVYPANQAGLAFDTLAEIYDAHFTRSSIGVSVAQLIPRVRCSLIRATSTGA